MFRASSGFIATLAALLSIAQAQNWKDEIHPKSPGSFPLPKPGILHYQVSWKGMVKAGRVKLQFAPETHPKNSAYVVHSEAASVGAASTLFPYWSTFWSETDSATLVARKFFSTEKDRKESIATESAFSASHATTKENTTDLKTRKTEATTKQFGFAPIHDLFSAILFIRSQKLENGEKFALVVHPFGTPYLVRIRVADRHQHNGQPAIHLVVSMRKIDRKTQELKPYKKMRKEASLWISDDDKRIPLELRASVFIGDVRATLVNHQ